MHALRTDRLRVCLLALMTGLLLGGWSLWQTHQEARSHKVLPLPPVIHRQAHASNTTSPPFAATPPDIANPIHLIIPAIALNAPIEPVGVLPNGNLGTPTHRPWENAGWYNLGPRPGEAGSVVIDGHLDRPGGLPAVFWHLRELHAGDQVIVVDARGKRLFFRVTRLAWYTVQTAPIQEIFGNGQGSYLNLITCAGDWIPEQHQTAMRLVVYTTHPS